MQNVFMRIGKNAIMGGAAILLIALLFFYFFSGGASKEPALLRIGASPLEGALGSDLLATLARLKSTTLDTSIFTDPVFTSLRDFGVTIAPQPVGRRNPFAILSASASGSKSASASAGSATSSKAKGTAPPLPSGGSSEFEFSF